jgi:hypothetical protein
MPLPNCFWGNEIFTEAFVAGINNTEDASKERLAAFSNKAVFRMVKTQVSSHLCVGA